MKVYNADKGFSGPPARDPEIDKDYNKIPAEGEEILGKFIYGRFLVAKSEKDRLRMHEKWMKNYELKRGKHFQNRSAKVPLVPVNIFYVAVSRTKANLTDNKPRFEIHEHQDDSEEFAFQFNAAANYWWKYNQQQQTLDESVENSETYGTSIEKGYFNPALEGGIGDVEFNIVDPFKFFPWPGIKKIQNMPFCFEVEILELSEIRRRWPENGKKVTAETQWSQLLGAERETIKAGSFQQLDTTNNLPSNYVNAPTEASDKLTDLKRALVIECWMKDYSTETFEEERVVEGPEGPIVGPEGPLMETIEITRPKYPGNIRVIHITNSGLIVLDDLSNPSLNPVLLESQPDQVRESYLYDKYPYIKNVSNLDNSNFWGFSIIEQIEVLGKELNKKISQIAAHIDKAVRPTLIIPNNAGIESSQITNMPGLKLFPNMAASQFIRHLDMPSLPSDYSMYIELLLRLVDTITGLHDVTQGRKPKGVSAGNAIVALQEKAETMLREKVRNLDLLIESRGKIWMSLVRNWYTEERTIRMSGVAIGRDKPKFVNFKGINVIGKYTFEVSSGSTMPKSSFVRQEQAIQLFREQAIDQIELLLRLDYPNAEEIVARMAQGPLGELLQRLNEVGLPEEMLKTIQVIGSMDENEYNKFIADQEARENEIIHNEIETEVGAGAEVPAGG